jgi:hypothetical protein
MLAAAACGMSESEFWDTTPRYLSARLTAINKAQQLTWEQTRFVSVHVMNAAGAKLKRFTDLVKFDWDVAKKAPTINAEDLPMMAKFDEQADLILKKTNPEAYAAFMAGKQKEDAK